MASSVEWLFAKARRAVEQGTPNDYDKDGQTLLHKAASQGDVETLEYLLENCTLHSVADARVVQPLHCAARCGWVEAILALLAAGASVHGRSADLLRLPGWKMTQEYGRIQH